VAVLLEEEAAAAVVKHLPLLLCRQVQAQPLEVPIGEKGRRLADLKRIEGPERQQ
jgi:hypothetical protein